MTFSLVARDPATQDLGVAVQSKFLAVGSVVGWAKAGVGALATQSFANVAYGPDGLAALEGGASAQEAVDRLVTADDLRAERQLGIVDSEGRAATFTGRSCFAWAGGRIGPNMAAQGNILAGPAVVDTLADTFAAGGGPCPERLVACLAAADAAGGDRRGRQSASLLVVREGGGYGGGNDRWIDLRVDDHPDPITELGRILALHRLYLNRPGPEDLASLDEVLAAELRQRLSALGAGPGGSLGRTYERMWPDDAPSDEPRPSVGAPRPYPGGWDDGWQHALEDWMAVENLEERTAAPGWIDPRVVDHLRSLSQGR
jgi:uncharacterized Ntn-hydrolase superfamily protein